MESLRRVQDITDVGGRHEKKLWLWVNINMFCIQNYFNSVRLSAVFPFSWHWRSYGKCFSSTNHQNSAKCFDLMKCRDLCYLFRTFCDNMLKTRQMNCSSDSNCGKWYCMYNQDSDYNYNGKSIVCILKLMILLDNYVKCKKTEQEL